MATPLFPIAISSQIDHTGAERVHAVPIKEDFSRPAYEFALYFTSTPYAVIAEPDGVVGGASIEDGTLRVAPEGYSTDSVGGSLTVLDGTLLPLLLDYTILPEGAVGSVTVIDGELRQLLLSTTMAAEGANSSITVIDGTLLTLLITTTVPPEGVNSSITIIGGTLV